MDRLDLRILKTLLVNNGVPPGVPILRKSFRSMGRELGVDQGTIRRRIKRFQESHVLKGWYLGVDPGLTGCDVVQAWFEVKGESSKGDLIERVLSNSDVERACNYMGPKISVVLFDRRRANPNTSLGRLSKLVGTRGIMHKSGTIPVPTRSLKKTDAEIIASLRNDPWKSFTIVAKEFWLSEKTVRRRVAALSEESLIYMLPIIDLKALQGVVPVELVVDYDSPESRRSVNEKISSRIKEDLVFSDSSGPHGYFALVVPNVSHVEQIADWVSKLQGVRGVHPEVLQDVMLNRKHYGMWSTPPEMIAKKGKAVALTEAVRA